MTELRNEARGGSAPAAADAPTAAKPLRGVHIIDFTWIGVGPMGTNILANLGADVIRVESNTHLDFARRGNSRTGGDGLALNMGKRSIQLNMKHPDAPAVVFDLLRHCDVVTENFRPGTMERFGIGYETLKQRRPDLVYGAAYGFGSTGPRSKMPGFAGIFMALGGLGYLTGYEDGPPTEVRASVDMRCGARFGLAVLAAICRRFATGEGAYVEISSQEVVASLVGDRLLEYPALGISPGRRGNDVPGYAPHNTYPCRGDDEWVAIAVGSDREWSHLCQAMGRPDLSLDDRYDTNAKRWRRRRDLDALVAKWTPGLSAAEVVEWLQPHVPAAPVQNAITMLEDEHLRARGAFEQLPDGDVLATVPTAAWIVDGQPRNAWRPAPGVGQDNEEIYCRLLGWSAERLAEAKTSQLVY